MEKLQNAVVSYSGDEIDYKEVNSDGSDLTTPDTWHPFGHIQSSEINDVPGYEDIPSEAGKVVRSVEQDRAPKVTGNMLQSDKATLDFFSKDCVGKFYAIRKYEGVNNNNHQEFFIPVIAFKRMLQLASGTKRPPFEGLINENKAAITIDSVDLPPNARTADPVTIAAGEYYTIVETPIS